jgi:zona occludens toxin (predicted ATPase)
MTRRIWTTLALGLTIAAPACKKKTEAPAASADTAAMTPSTSAPAPAETPFAVQGVELGKHIGADKRVSAPATTFAPKDTIYAVVTTEGTAPSKTIVAKWTYGAGKAVKTDSQTIAPSGPAATEFHIVKPSGWPAGKYKVDIAVDGSSAASQEFEVKK